MTLKDLYQRAKELDIPGRSKMNKEQLQNAIQEAERTDAFVDELIRDVSIQGSQESGMSDVPTSLPEDTKHLPRGYHTPQEPGVVTAMDVDTHASRVAKNLARSIGKGLKYTRVLVDELGKVDFSTLTGDKQMIATFKKIIPVTGQPMTSARRAEIYRNTRNGSFQLTPKQQKRLRKKRHATEKRQQIREYMEQNAKDHTHESIAA